MENNEKFRMNIRVAKEVQEYYKSEADRYNTPYTTYISMILTRIYESDKEINKNWGKSQN